jgi:uncharacterized protein
MQFRGLLGAAALGVASLQATTAGAQTMDMKISASNPVVAIGVTETEDAAPDMATLSAGVEASNSDAKKALDEANRKMEKLIAAIKAAKFDPKDVQTSTVSVNEDFDYTENGPVSKGFKAQNNVTLTVRNLSKLQKVISDLVNAEATSINGPYFSIENDDAITDKARMKAFDVGKRRALAYANKAGFKSVRLLQVRENATDSIYGFYGNEAAAAGAAAAADAAKSIADTPIEPGIISRSVTVTFHFEMVP